MNLKQTTSFLMIITTLVLILSVKMTIKKNSIQLYALSLDYSDSQAEIEVLKLKIAERLHFSKNEYLNNQVMILVEPKVQQLVYWKGQNKGFL